MVNRAAKNKVKKGKKGKKQVDFDEDPYAQDALDEQTAPAAVGFEQPATTIDNEEADDLDWANDNKKGKKNNKKGGNTDSPAEPASPAPEKEEGDGEFRILTKKEKEKLKKEKLKEQKRLAALEKKQQQEAEDAEFNKMLGLEDKKDQEEGGDAQPQQKSKKQLLKEKKAKKMAAKEAEPEAAPVVEEPIAAPKGKKGKGGNVAALRVSFFFYSMHLTRNCNLLM